MKFYLTDTQETKEITMKNWTGSGYTPDYFYDMETYFPEEHEKDDDCNILCTSAEYESLKEWWEDEVEIMRNGGCDENGIEYEANDNIFLFAD